MVLRDLNEGWFGLGFAKSRGLGTVQVKLNSAVVQYPGCEVRDRQICSLGGQLQWSHTILLGAGEFLTDREAADYSFSKPDRQETPVAAEKMALGFGVQLRWTGNGEAGVADLFTRAVRSWSHLLRGETAA